VSSIPVALERIIALSRADDCIAIGSRTTAANIRWANNTSTTNGASTVEHLIVISVIGGRLGTMSRTAIPDDDGLEELVRASEAACEGKPEAEDRMPLLAGDGRAPDDWAEPALATGPETLGGFAADLAGLFARAHTDGIALFGYAEHETETTWLATSSGVRRRYTWPQGKVEITGKSPDFTRSTWAGRDTTTFADVECEQLYDKIRQRLSWAERRIELDPGRYEVLLEPAAVADMVLYQYISSARRDADEGRTVFSKPGGNRIGEQLTAPSVSLYSDPHEPGIEVPGILVTPASSSYASVFDNGLETGRVDWVRDGTLTNLITTRHWAARTDGAEAVPFIRNLILPSRGPALDQMIASSGRALLVTCFWYIREVDPQTLLLTGLTRDGVFLIEHGEVIGAVNNFRYNMSPVQMLAHVVEAGETQITLSREWEFAHAKIPPLRIADFNMSSVSDAT